MMLGEETVKFSISNSLITRALKNIPRHVRSSLGGDMFLSFASSVSFRSKPLVVTLPSGGA